jgi:type I restriction enzyme S subunit
MTESNFGQTLPNGWVGAELGAVVDVIRGISFPSEVKVAAPKDGYVACLRTTNVQREVDWENLWFVPAEYVKRTEQQVQPLDILVSVANSLELVGKVALVKSLPLPATLGTFISLIRTPCSLDAKFIYYQLASNEVQADLKSRASTTTNISNISTQKLRDTQLVIAPLPEQRRIVEAIETHFTRLDAAVDALKRVQANLRRYRASVLKAACEGRLVPTEAELARAEGRAYEPASALLERILAERRAKWEQENPGKKYKEPAAPDTSSLPELPEGWRWTNIGYMFDVKVGSTPSRGKSGYWNGNIDWVSSGEVAFNRISDTREKITSAGYENSSVKINPPGTVLLAMIGEGKTRGQAAILDIPATNNQNVAAILCSASPVPSEWIFYWLMAQYEQTRRGSSGGMQYALNSERVRAIKLPIAPGSEMRRIIEQVEARLSMIHQVEKIIIANLARIERLRQSILQRAFSGQLVPQDPNDEPASVLLERIRAARNGQPVQTSLL